MLQDEDQDLKCQDQDRRISVSSSLEINLEDYKTACCSHNNIPSFCFTISNIDELPQPPSMHGVVVHTCTRYLPTGSLQHISSQCQ